MSRLLFIRATFLATAILGLTLLPPRVARAQTIGGSFGGTFTRPGVGTTTPTPGGTLIVHAMPFFSGEVNLGDNVSYLVFPNGNPFGYYSYLGPYLVDYAGSMYSDFLYHFDLGYEYVVNALDDKSGVYLYDFTSQTFFYTSPTFPFPYLYDFKLKTMLYYYPDPNNPGRYNTDGVRYFYNYATGQIITK